MTDIFNNTDAGGDQNQQNTPPNNDGQQQTNALSELVGEGKKFSTVEELAASKLSADQHIAKLEAEAKERNATLAELQQKAEGAASVEEILKALSGSQTEGKETPAPTLDEQSIDEIITRRLSEQERSRIAKANLKSANDAVVNALGDLTAAQTAVNKKAQQIGMTAAELAGIAAKSPSAFLQIMGIDKPSSDKPAPVKGTVNPEAVQNAEGTGGPKPGTHAWYQNLRKENPSAYFSAKVQNQMFTDRKEKGEAFYQ